MNDDTLVQQNRDYDGTCGISANCRRHGFQPAFREENTGRVELSRQRNGEPCPMHLISWLPQEWAADAAASGAIVTLKPGIVAGFVYNGAFYTREQAARGDNCPRPAAGHNPDQ